MLLRALIETAPADIRIVTLDLKDVPLFNQDLEKDPPAPVKRLREAIRAADALLIVSPEHNGLVPAVTKNVIEWASRPPEESVLDGKPAGVLGASTSYFGTVRMQIMIRQIGPIENVLFMQEPAIHVSRAPAKFDDQGRLIDEALRAQLGEFVGALAAWTRKIKG
jgi:chromate reductase